MVGSGQWYGGDVKSMITANERYGSRGLQGQAEGAEEAKSFKWDMIIFILGTLLFVSYYMYTYQFVSIL